jgi:hypothetical protein
VTPWGILPAQPVIFVTIQQVVIKVNAGALHYPEGVFLPQSNVTIKKICCLI